MAHIPMKVQKFILGKTAWVATVDPDGRLNVAPKGSIQLIDDQTLLYFDIFPKKTTENLENHSQIAVGVIERGEGYQFKGRVTLLNSGQIFDDAKATMAEKTPGLPAPKYVVKIDVEEVYILTPGPKAGNKIA